MTLSTVTAWSSLYHHHRLKGPGKPTAPNKYTLGRTIPKKMKFSKRKAALSDPLSHHWHLLHWNELYNLWVTRMTRTLNAKTLSWPFFNAIFAFSSTTLHVCTSATGNASGLHHAHWGRQQSHTRKHAKRMALENQRGISNALRHPKRDSNDSHKTWNCCGRRHSVSHWISSHPRLYRPAQCGNRASHHRTLVSRYRSCAWYSSIAWYLCKVAAASPTVGKHKSDLLSICISLSVPRRTNCYKTKTID